MDIPRAVDPRDDWPEEWRRAPATPAAPAPLDATPVRALVEESEAAIEHAIKTTRYLSWHHHNELRRLRVELRKARDNVVALIDRANELTGR